MGLESVLCMEMMMDESELEVGEGTRDANASERRRWWWWWWGVEGGDENGGGDDVVCVVRVKWWKVWWEREGWLGRGTAAVTFKFVVCGTVFEVDVKYVFIKLIGKGVYGVVCSVRELEMNRKVVIKKIVNVFENVVDAKRTLREIKLLRYLRYENVIDIIDCVKFCVKDVFEDVYLMYDFMDIDLY